MELQIGLTEFILSVFLYSYSLQLQSSVSNSQEEYIFLKNQLPHPTHENNLYSPEVIFIF